MGGAKKLVAEEAGWAAMGRHLRDLRVGHGWSQPELEEASGVSVATIRSIENHREGKQHTPRTLKLLSRGLGLEDDYLANYLENPPADPGREPEGVKAAPPPPRPVLDFAARVDEIVVNRLKEIVVPPLKMMEEQVRRLADVTYETTGRKIELDVKHLDDPE
jgi:transcriptional regulator with XRE-family HTH domain